MTTTPTSIPRRNRSSAVHAAPAAATAVQQNTSAEAAPSRFTSVGALFQGREPGELHLRLEPAFLAALGYPIHSGQQVTLILKNRHSRHGRAYRSVFLAIEDT